MADGADPLLGFGLDQLLHHHPDRRAAQIHASPGGLAHLRGDWVGKEIGALNPFGGTTPARSRAVGGSTTQLAAEAVVRAARALKRWAAIDVEKANRVSRRSDIRAASLWRPLLALGRRSC